MRAGGDPFAVEHEAEAATLLDAAHLAPFGHPLPHLGHECLACDLARGVGTGVVLLGHGHEELQMHIQAELEQRFGGINDSRGQRLTWRQRGLVRRGGGR